VVLIRVRVVLGGWPGAPGYSIFHGQVVDATPVIDGIGNFVQELHDAYNGIRQHLIGGVTVDIEPEAAVLDEASGEIQSIQGFAAPPTVAGGSSSVNLPRSTMANIRHFTGVVNAGRRINGRTFVGPLGGEALSGSGAIDPVLLPTFSHMFDGMQDIGGSARLAVYSRPQHDAAGVQTRPGRSALVVSSLCNSAPGGLRSRRD
jgi:hypothetical protein